MPSTEAIRNIQRLIWLYFWLLIFEGALRKWVIPQFATPLLIVRDPVVIGVYFIALRAGLFPKNLFTKVTIFLAYISFLGGLATVIISNNDLVVTFFGLRTNFLHLPLIFLIPKMFNLEDVKNLGKWVLLLSLPMAILMIYQFSSPPDAFINRIAGTGEGLQIASSMGKIRPPGTFSFITGVAQYFSLVASFLLYGLIESKIYPNWLLAIAGLGLVLALAVSGSRTTVASVGLVFISLIVVFLIRPALVGKSYRFLAILAVVGFSVSYIPFFNEGVEVLNSRVENANAVEASSGGFTGRFINSLLEPFYYSDGIPILGYGLGMGTNAGSALLTGKVEFLLAEGEWARVIFESGLILGSLYILLRIAIVGWMGILSIKSTFASNILPLLLFSACAINVLNAQFGQPAILGFTILVSGLCLASCRMEFHSQALLSTR